MIRDLGSSVSSSQFSNCAIVALSGSRYGTNFIDDRVTIYSLWQCSWYRGRLPMTRPASKRFRYQTTFTCCKLNDRSLGNSPSTACKLLNASEDINNALSHPRVIAKRSVFDFLYNAFLRISFFPCKILEFSRFVILVSFFKKKKLCSWEIGVLWCAQMSNDNLYFISSKLRAFWCNPYRRIEFPSVYLSVNVRAPIPEMHAPRCIIQGI